MQRTLSLVSCFFCASSTAIGHDRFFFELIWSCEVDCIELLLVRIFLLYNCRSHIFVALPVVLGLFAVNIQIVLKLLFSPTILPLLLLILISKGPAFHVLEFIIAIVTFAQTIGRIGKDDPVYLLIFELRKSLVYDCIILLIHLSIVSAQDSRKRDL